MFDYREIWKKGKIKKLKEYYFPNGKGYTGTSRTV